MSLIDKINASLLIKLASGSSVDTAASKINGKGANSSFGGDAVNLSESLKNIALAFKNSDARLISPIAVLGGTKQILSELKNINSQLIDLAQRASLEDTSDDERSSINLRFQELVQDYRQILDSSTVNDIDLRTKSDLGDLLKYAGIDLFSNSDLAKAFSELAPVDGEIGYSSIAKEDVVIVSQSGDIEVGRANGSSDPLEEDLQSRSGATIAYNTLLELQKDLENDQKNVGVMIKEIVGASNFSFVGNSASIELLDSNLNSSSPEELAKELVRQIKSQASDHRIAEHSDIDRFLAQDLLS